MPVQCLAEVGHLLKLPMAEVRVLITVVPLAVLVTAPTGVHHPCLVVEVVTGVVVGRGATEVVETIVTVPDLLVLPLEVTEEAMGVVAWEAAEAMETNMEAKMEAAVVEAMEAAAVAMEAVTVVAEAVDLAEVAEGVAPVTCSAPC